MRFRAWILLVIFLTQLGINSAVAAPSITSGLTLSLDAQSSSSFSGSTWSGTDGTSNSATLVNTTYDSVNRLVPIFSSLSSPKYATLGEGTTGDAINPQGDLTVEAWVNFSQINTTNWNIVATRWFNGTGTADYHFGLHTGRLNLYTSAAGLQDFGVTSTNVVTAGWHQIAFTIINPTTLAAAVTGPDGNSTTNGFGSGANNIGTATLYLDGSVYMTVSGNNVYHVNNPSYDLDLGDRRLSSTLGIDGSIEKFRIYNRALSNSEINQNYRADANIRSLTAAPYNTTAPTITGSHVNATTETSTNGTWLNGVTSYSYQWARASTANGTYTNISGATSQTYQTVSADVGNYLKVTVSATNATGTYTATSAATPVITAAKANLTFTMNNQLPVYRNLNNLTASTGSVAGKVSFTINGKAIPGCKNKPVNAGNSYSAVCPWRPSSHSSVNIIATFTSADAGYTGTVGTISAAPGKARTNNR